MDEMGIESETIFLLENGDKICRVCFDSNQNNQHIFCVNDSDPENANGLDLVKKLIVQGGITVIADDGLPSNICQTCISKVNAAYEFRKQCQLADKKLRKVFGKPQESLHSDSTILLKNQFSQTEGEILLFVKDEDEVKKSNTSKNDEVKIIPSTDNETDMKYIDPFDTKITNNEVSATNESLKKDEITLIEKENAPFKREGCKTRKMTMFKRVTSMENLKSFKERQRQYIKKNTSTKPESNELDPPVPKKMRSASQRLSNLDSRLRYECDTCSTTFSSKRSLERHSTIHDGKKLRCGKCDEEFLRLDKLLEHCKLHQSKEKLKPVRCKICEKSFKKTDTMVRHLNVHKRANPKEVFAILKEIRDKRKMENSFEDIEENERSVNTELTTLMTETSSKQEDNICTKELRKRVTDTQTKQDTQSDFINTESNSDSDSDYINDMTMFRCKYCKKRYTTEKSLQRHMLIHDEKKFVCNVCNMKFFRPDRLKSHRDRYGHNEDKVSEPEKPPDDKSAIKLINSWIREELDSDNEGKGFPCDLCGKSYVTKKSLTKHRTNAHESQQNHCYVCGIDCVCKDKPKIHVKAEKTKIYTCDECGKSFEKENKLQKHLRIHERAKEQQDTNFKRFLCHICSKTFRQNTGLMFHMRTHTGYKPHVCKYCGRGFTSNSNCINHERTHTGDRPFVCHFCSAAFAKSCTLKAHITTHTGEANYHCKTCGKSFRRLKYLKEHKFTHTGEKPYACKICGTAYSHSGSLFVHEKKCKAQYNNFQSSSSQNNQNFCQTQASIVTSPPVIAPLITTLPPTHHLGNINHSLGTHAQVNKTYAESVQRMNAHAAAVGNSGLHVHQNTEVSDMASAVRNFAIIGQMFH